MGCISESTYCKCPFELMTDGIYPQKVYRSVMSQSVQKQLCLLQTRRVICLIIKTTKISNCQQHSYRQQGIQYMPKNSTANYLNHSIRRRYSTLLWLPTGGTITLKWIIHKAWMLMAAWWIVSSNKVRIFKSSTASKWNFPEIFLEKIRMRCHFVLYFGQGNAQNGY